MTTIMQSPKTSVFSKAKQRPLRIMVLGLSGIGKTALVVRYITKRFIGEYDPTLEKVYNHQIRVGNETIMMEILDSANQSHETESVQLEANMRWAEAFILMYSVTDKCSFDECNRLKFLINYNKRRRRLICPCPSDVPVVLVANKKDQLGDRMVSRVEGHKRCKDIGCVAFHEISVRETPDEVRLVFDDLYRHWRSNCKTAKLKRSTSDLHHGPISLNTFKFIITGNNNNNNNISNGNNSNNDSSSNCSSGNGRPWCGSAAASNATSTGSSTSTSTSTPAPLSLLLGGGRLGTPWTDCLLDSRQGSLDGPINGRGPLLFRDRASTDSSLHKAKKIPYEKVKRSLFEHICSPIFDRRMSINMGGSNASC